LVKKIFCIHYLKFWNFIIRNTCYLPLCIFWNKNIYIYPQLDPNLTITCKTNIQMKNMMLWIYNRSSHLQNIWNDDTDDEIGDTHLLIPITNTLRIDKYDLKNDFIIQSCNTLDHKTIFFEDVDFTILSNSMIMDESEYQSMLKQLNTNKD